MTRQFEETSRIHLALNITHLKKSVEFYKALFDIQPSKIKPGYAKFEASSPPVNLTLNSAEEVTGNRINHLGIEVKAGKDVHKQNLRLKNLGLDTFYEESTLCCYAVQDKVWVKDPDGNAWETFIVLNDSEEKYGKDRSPICCGSSPQPESSCCN